ncbi:helix-turn-helix transcriptional regulator [Limisalsivibrio acetivorans]|uniref:helix-turn-helix transcriptional regulator n=1 Tax=Limisalsivibrio acetivorans TaxID=1304888 RepID=UPI0003B5B378|nr:PAS domain-containing protein [Limisalsivibrio acetivorans]
MSEKTTLSEIVSQFTEEDKNIIRSYEDVLEGIAAFFGSHCEVVLHSLENIECSITKIVNGHLTGRQEGHPITDKGLQVILDYKRTGRQHTDNYITNNSLGEPMRSITTIITNRGKAIGLICINFSLSMPLADFIKEFNVFRSEGAGEAKQEEFFVNSVEDLIHNAVNDIYMEIGTKTSIANHEKNKHIVHTLYERGIFDIKGSVVMVAEHLKLSKYTIYSYIRELKESRDNGAQH